MRVESLLSRRRNAPALSAPEKNISSPHHLPFFSRARDFPPSALGPDTEVLNKYEASQSAYLPRFVVKAKMAETEWLCGPSLAPRPSPAVPYSLYVLLSFTPQVLVHTSLTLCLSLPPPFPLPLQPNPSPFLSPISRGLLSIAPFPPKRLPLPPLNSLQIQCLILISLLRRNLPPQS